VSSRASVAALVLKGSTPDGPREDSTKPADHEETKKPTGRNIQRILKRGGDGTGAFAAPKAADIHVRGGYN
jgi:hypothetical protein